MADAGVEPVVGVLGGSGLYELDALSGARWEKIESPFAVLAQLKGGAEES